MAKPGPKCCVFSLMVLAAAAADARAQDETIHLDPLEWEATVDFDGAWRRSESQKTRDLDVETRLRFKQSGFSLDPRIARFAIEVEPRISHGDLSGTDQDETRDGVGVNYNATANIFSGTPDPFGYDLLAARSSDTTEGSLGSRTDFTLETYSVGTNWKSRVFPSTLSLTQRSLQQKFESGLTDVTSERDDVLRTLSYRGRSSKLDLFLERDWLDDLTDRNSDYTSNRFRAGHRFPWGRGSQLNSRADYLDRNGFNPFERFTLDETVDIEHAANLRSTTGYRFTSLTQTTTTTENAGSFSLTHDLYDSLSTTGHTSASVSDGETLDELSYEGGLDLSYRKKIFWGGQFTASAGAAYRITDRVSAGGFDNVVDESHVVPVTGIVILDRRFVTLSSILVTDATGIVILTEGADYTLSSAGGDLIELFILPGGLASPGDTILVSYAFGVLPSAKFSTVPYQYSAAVDFGWIMVFHQQSASEESLISGAGESSLTDRENSTTGLQLRWDGETARATLSAQKRFDKTGGFETDSLDFGQTFAYDFSPGTAVTLSLSEIFTESTNRNTDLYTADASLRWRPRSNLFVRPHVGYWMRSDSGTVAGGGSTDESYFVGGLDVQWFWRLLSVSARYEHNRRETDLSASSEDRIMITVTRRSQ